MKTRAENSNYEETSRYQEVVDFMRQIAGASSRIHLTDFGESFEGRALPLAVIGAQEAAPEAVLAEKKTRVYVQGNIHAGEVCGKEALQMLLRDLATGKHSHWADSLVLLFAPIYNADGNERIDLKNRPRQHGPLKGMGQRPNAEGYDLNRDHIKLDSPEARALVRLFNRYDPHVIIDLHTTNGTRHAYHITYSPPLNPNTPQAIDAFLREKWLPEVTQKIKAKHNWDYYYYGNLPWRGRNAERGWYTFDHRPRFNNNYAGLRNRFGILSEAYSYATFEDRVLATLYFVEEILDFAQANAANIRAIAQQADRQTIVGRELAVRARLAKSTAPVEILLGEVTEEKNPYSGETILRRKDISKPEKMYEYGTFSPSETAVAPAAYYVPPSQTKAIELLDAHGIRYSKLTSEKVVKFEQFRIDSIRTAARAFQKHRQATLFGAYESSEGSLPEGTVVVPVDQPLGRLAFYLLEPRSDDGLANWNLMGESIKQAKYFPIQREPAK
ncbi:MAG: M14 family metallopeptidase [bacterium]